ELRSAALAKAGAYRETSASRTLRFAGYSRRGVGGNVEHILRRQLLHDRLHEIGPGALASAQLHVVQLAYKVTWGTTSEAGNRTKAFEIGAVAYPALRCFAAACRHQRLAFLYTARRHIGHEAGSGIAQRFGLLSLLRRFYDPLPDRFLACFGSL